MNMAKSSLNMYLIASILLALRISQPLPIDVNDTEIVVEMTLMEKYEYCVKLITVCYTIWDTPIDYDEIDSVEMMRGDIEKLNCVPQNLSEHDTTLFWNTVSKWQDEVKEILASGDGFTIQEQFNDGRSIRVQLWTVFKKRKVIVCNRDITDEPIFKPCDDGKEIGIWISEQIDKKQQMIYLIDRLPNTLHQLILQVNNKCCPYAILRDRYEIINDYMDSIMQLKTIDRYERIKSTNYAILDIHNLMTRVQYLDEKTIHGRPFNSNCCKNNWLEQLKSFNINIEGKTINLLDNFLPAMSLKPLFDSQYKLNNRTNNQFDRLQREEKLIEKVLLTKSEQQANCCDKLNASIGDIDNNIISFKSYNLKLQSNKDILGNNVIITRDNIEFTQNLVNSGQKEIDQLEQKWKIYIDNLGTKISIDLKISYLDGRVHHISDSINPKSALVGRIDSMNFDKTFRSENRNLQVIEDELERLLAQTPIRKKKPIPRILTFAELKNDRVVKYCLQVIDQQTEELTKLHTLLNQNSDLNKELIAKAIVSKLYDHLDTLLKNAQATEKINSKQTESLKSLEKEIQDISMNTEENTLAGNKQFQNIINYQDKLTEDLRKERQKINLIIYNNTDSVDNQINQQESNSKPNKLNQNENSILYIKVNEKIDNLNEILSQIKVKNMKGQKIMLETIDKLETKLNLLIDKTNKAKTAALKCSLDCDLGELPSIQELTNRLKLLNKIKK